MWFLREADRNDTPTAIAKIPSAINIDIITVSLIVYSNLRQ
jgi:hypothetical protein